jgi:Ca2+/H+ antiporter, TMEM165/GDT1 family
VIAPKPPLPDVLSESALSKSALPKKALSKNELGAFWGVFLSTFITIFLAELGDKTQVATLLLSAQSHAPVVVFLGAGLALVSTSLIGVLLGQWMSKRVSEDALDTCAGILLLLITIGLVGDIVGR